VKNGKGERSKATLDHRP